MLMDGQWYGYLRTASGNPLTLQNAKRLRKLTIYGNAVQDGTPTPDNPIDVQLCGDRTVNLFDVQNINWNAITIGLNAASSIYFENGVIRFVKNTAFYNQCRMLASIQLKPNTTYTMMYDHAVMNYKDGTSITQNSPYFRIYKSSDIDSTFNSTGINNYYAATSSTILTFTTDETTDFEILFNSPIVPKTELLNTLKSYEVHGFMLIEGAYTAETMPAYEPYGYKVPLTMTGMNLLSNNENDWVGDAGIYKHFKIPVEGTTTLQVKIKEGKSIPEKLYLGYSKNGMDATGGVTWLIDNGIFNGAPIRTSELKYISIHPKTALLDEIFDSLDIMLIEGAYTTETMPAYEPYQPPPQDFAVYLPEQIAKVGDVADEVVVDMERKTAELRKNVGSVVADGNESWVKNIDQYDTADYTNRCSIFGDIHGNYRTPGYFSNRFERKLDIMWVNPNSEAFNINDNQLHLSISNTRLGITADDEATDRTTKFKAWLNDNNVTVYAPLAEPVTTDITSLQQWDAMPQVKGTVTLTLSAEVPPSGAEAIYYSKERNTE